MCDRDDEKCPSAYLLSRFATGEVDDALLGSISKHLDWCDACVADLSRLEIDVPIDSTSGQEFFETLSATELDTLSCNLWEFEIPEMIGKYPIKRKIAAGGMGVVYEARHPNLMCDVVIKTIKPQRMLRLDARDRMLEEQRAMGRIRHSSIVAVLDADVDGDLPFLVMEKLDGKTLRQWAREARTDASRRPGPGRIDWRIACRIGRCIAIALDQLHDAGLIHRDVKPGNVMVMPTGDVKLLDLGLAVDVGLKGDPVTTQAAGTPAFLAPEQLGNHPIDFRTDLYGLGTTLVFLLGDSRTQDPTRRYGRSDLPERGIPKSLRCLITELLAQDPAERPSSARVVADRLQQIEERHRQVTMIRMVAALGFLLTISLVGWSVWPATPARISHSSSQQASQSPATSRIFRRENLSYRGPQAAPVTTDFDSAIPRSNVLNARVSRNESFMACFDVGGNLRIYDLRNPSRPLVQLIRCYETANTACPQINWMNNDTVVAVTGAGYAPLLFWDVVNRTFIAAVETPQQIVGIDTDLTSTRLAVIDTSGRLAVYDNQGILYRETLLDSHEIPSAVKWANDSKSILLAVEGGLLYQISVTQDPAIDPIEVYRHSSTVTAIELGQQGCWYLGDSKGILQQVDPQFRSMNSFELSDLPIHSIVEASEAGELYVSAKEISRINIAKGSHSSVVNAPGAQLPVYLQRAGNQIVCAGGDVSSIRIDDPDKTETLLNCDNSTVTDLSFDPAGERIAVCIGDSLVVTDSAGHLSLMHHFSEGKAESLSWSPDGRQLAVVSGWGGEYLYLFQEDGATNTLQFSQRVQKPKCVVGVAWLDQYVVGIAGEKGVLHEWDTRTNRFVASHPLGDFVRSFSVSPDHQRLAFGFQTKGILVLNSELKKIYSDSESYKSTPVRTTRWHTDNIRLAAMDSMKRVLIYNLESEQRDVHVPSPWSQPISISWTGERSEIEIAPLGRFTTTKDGTLLETRADRRDRIVDWSGEGGKRIAANETSTLHFSIEGELKWSLLFDRNDAAQTVDATGNIVSSWGTPSKLVR